jgi:hypothetical protein
MRSGRRLVPGARYSSWLRGVLSRATRLIGPKVGAPYPPKDGNLDAQSVDSAGAIFPASEAKRGARGVDFSRATTRRVGGRALSAQCPFRRAVLIRYSQGIHLPGPDLWLDPPVRRPRAIVSHAHSDHARRHDEVWATPATAAMMRLRGLTGCEFRALPFGRPQEIGGAVVTLFPAGHILGSAQVLVEWEGCRLLYSGDFKLRPGRAAETAEVPAADVVVMETTFGRPHYRFPATAAVLADIRAFCSAAREAGETPVLFSYSLGKGQELLAGLEGLEWPVYLHSAHWKMAALYQDLGVRLPPFRKLQPGQEVDGVLLCAPGCRKNGWFHRLARPRTAYISGWALDGWAARRFRTDAAFPLSDHAGYDDLLEYVRRAGAGRVYTLHGFAVEFARDLRRRGLWAEPLREPGPQLALPL